MAETSTLRTVDPAELARCLFEGSKDGLFVFDPTSLNLIDVNPQAQRLTGQSRQRLLKSTLPELFGSEDPKVMGDFIASCRATRQFHSRRACRLSRQTGVPIEVNVTVNRLNSSPDVLGVVAAHEIGNPIDAEANLHRAQALLKSSLEEQSAHLETAAAELRAGQFRINELLNDVGAIVWEAELPSRRFTYVNQQAESILGYAICQWMGESDFWVQHIHADDMAQSLRLLDESAEQGVDCEFDHRAIAADGHIVWLRVVVHVVNDSSGVPTKLRGVMTDVTDRIHAEQYRAHLAAIVDSTPDAIVSSDVDGKVVSWNKGAQELFQYTAGEVIGRSAMVLMPEEQREEAMGIVEQVRNGSIVRGHETVRCRKDGTRVDVSMTVAPIRDDRGLVVGVSVVGHDITGQKIAEARIRQRSRRQSVIATLGLVSLQTNELSGLLRRATVLLAETIGVEFAKVLELSESGEALLMVAGVGWPQGSVGTASVPASGDSQASHTLRQNQPVVVSDLPRETRFSGPALLIDNGVLSGISVIIQGATRPYGVLGVHSTERRIFSSDEVNFVQSIANLLGNAIARASGEKQLRQSELSLAKAQEIAQIGSWQYDIASGEIVGSATLHRLLGVPEDQQRSYLEFLQQHVHPADRGIVEAGNTDALMLGQTTPLEFRVLRPPEMEVRYVRIQSEFADETIVIGTLQDITEQRRADLELERARDALRASEERYRTIVETTKEWIWESDAEGIQTFSNSAIESILGYAPHEVIGKSSISLMHEEDRQKLESKLPEMMSSGTGWSQWIVRWRHKDGSVRYLESNGVPVRDANGQLIGYRGADRDITARVHAEEELRARERELAHVSRLSTMGEMVAGIAHEVNQPLTAISNYANASLAVFENSTQQFDAPVSEWMRHISEQAVRCGDIIRSLRRFSQRHDAERVSVDLNSAIEDSLAVLKPLLVSDSVLVDIRLPQRKLLVMAHETELQQVLVNLLRNARDATVDAAVEQPTIRMQAAVKDGTVDFTIHDNGPGVDPRWSVSLFDAFFTTRHDGMGMGLAISKSIVENHGGRLWLDERPSEGACFHLELPLAAEACEQHDG